MTLKRKSYSILGCALSLSLMGPLAEAGHHDNNEQKDTCNVIQYHPDTPNNGRYHRSTIDISSRAFTVGQGATHQVKLPRRLYVHKLMIQAESANRDDSYGEVFANGDVKGTLYLPGVDPHYIVTIADTTSSIEFTTIENSMKIIRIKAVVSDTSCKDRPLKDAYSSEIADIAEYALKLSNYLESHVSYRDYGNYFLLQILLRFLI